VTNAWRVTGAEALEGFDRSPFDPTPRRDIGRGSGWPTGGILYLVLATSTWRPGSMYRGTAALRVPAYRKKTAAPSHAT
jgi:hypothetical protein